MSRDIDSTDYHDTNINGCHDCYECKRYEQQIEQKDTRIRELDQRNKDLTRLFIGYSDHKAHCNRNRNGIDGDCDCGWFAAVEEVKERATKQR